jgi:RNA polymerase sigma-70 factor (ECF subfamily)
LRSQQAHFLESAGARDAARPPERDRCSAEAIADLRLAEDVRNKDRKATAEFVERHSDAVWSYVSYRLLSKPADAEDVVQEVFLAALQSITNYSGAASLQTWLLGIARHKVEDYYRRALRNLDLESPDPEELGSDFGEIEVVQALDVREKTLRALACLRAEYRILLQWRYWDMKTAAEMAALTGRTEKAIERALARARAQFKTAWEGGHV